MILGLERCNFLLKLGDGGIFLIALLGKSTLSCNEHMEEVRSNGKKRKEDEEEEEVPEAKEEDR